MWLTQLQIGGVVFLTHFSISGGALQQKIQGFDTKLHLVVRFYEQDVKQGWFLYSVKLV